MFRFEIKDGVISLHSTYRYERSAATNLLAVTNTTFALKSLQMVEKDTGQAAVEVSSFVVTGASVDAMARQAEADTMTVTGGRFVLRRNKDTSVNAIELLKPADAAPPRARRDSPAAPRDDQSGGDAAQHAPIFQTAPSATSTSRTARCIWKTW